MFYCRMWRRHLVSSNSNHCSKLAITFRLMLVVMVLGMFLLFSSTEYKSSFSYPNSNLRKSLGFDLILRLKDDKGFLFSSKLSESNSKVSNETVKMSQSQDDPIDGKEGSSDEDSDQSELVTFGAPIPQFANDTSSHSNQSQIVETKDNNATERGNSSEEEAKSDNQEASKKSEAAADGSSSVGGAESETQIGNKIPGQEIAGNEQTSVNTSSVENSPDLPQCSIIPRGLQGRLKVSTEVPTWKAAEKNNPDIEMGGKYRPSHCSARHKVAIIVPFRNREEQLKMFLNHLHPILRRQELDYRIYIINQAGEAEFNRAMLLNVGFVEAMLDYDWGCSIFHDVDLLPEDDRNLYSCPESQPRHMSVAVDKFKYRLPYKTIFGGVTAIRTEHFRLLNGYSNQFWGWGGEDDDMSKRIRYHKLQIARYKPEIARYTMIKHKQETANKNRMKILKAAFKRFKTDGLNNLQYEVLARNEQPLYTNITVLLTHKEAKIGNKSRRQPKRH